MITREHAGALAARGLSGARRAVTGSCARPRPRRRGVRGQRHVDRGVRPAARAPRCGSTARSSGRWTASRRRRSSGCPARTSCGTPSVSGSCGWSRCTGGYAGACSAASGADGERHVDIDAERAYARALLSVLPGRPVPDRRGSLVPRGRRLDAAGCSRALISSGVSCARWRWFRAMMAPVAATPASPASPSAFHSFIRAPFQEIRPMSDRTQRAHPRRRGRPDPHRRRVAVPRPLRRRPRYPGGDQQSRSTTSGWRWCSTTCLR